MPPKTTLYLLILLVICMQQQLKSQSLNLLSDQSFDELYEQSKTLFSEKNTQKALLYFEAYKQKAIKEGNHKKLINGYRSMAIWQDSLKQKISYADSAIYIAEKTKNKEFLGNALYTKGVVYYKHNDWNKTLDYYLRADEHITQTNNNYLKHKIKFSIANTKYTIGYYDEAFTTIKECITYFKQFDDNNHRNGYLSSLHSLGLCLNRMGKYKECSEVNTEGLKKAIEFDINEMEYSFMSSEGINQYNVGNYSEAIRLLEQSLLFFVTVANTKQQTVTHFFIGKSYVEQNKEKQAITHFDKVDSLFTETGYLRDDMTENYVFLINNAKKYNDLEKELYYTNRLLEADKRIHNQYKDIAVTIHKKYETKKLEESKTTIEKLLIQKSKNNKWLTLSLLAALISILLLTIRYIYYKKKFQKLYKKFMENKLQETQHITTTISHYTEQVSVAVSQQEIKEEVTHKILKKLERFENSKGFIKQNLTLSKLAENLKTNPKYLSKIIVEYKHKEYIQYINDLRIDYLMEFLNSKKHLEYTIEALAKEIGFNSAKGFNTVFYKTTGMRFSSFLSEFRKEKKHHYLVDTENNLNYGLTEIL